MIKLNFKKLHEEALLPSCKHESDAGRDIYTVDTKVIPAHCTMVFSTGIALQMEWEISTTELRHLFKPFFKISSRSGLASKGIHVIGGIVDLEYSGIIRVILANTSNENYSVTKGDRIAQGIVELIPQISSIGWVNEFEETERGGNGFGSSGR